MKEFNDNILIVGLDLSKNHYALVYKSLRTKEFGTCFGWHTESKVKKWKKLFPNYNIDFIPPKKREQSIEQYNMECAFILDKIMDENFYILKEKFYIDYCDIIISLENYAYGGSVVVDIAEVTGVVKFGMLANGVKIRTHDPQSVKMWAGKGDLDKKEMLKASLQHIQIPKELQEGTNNPAYDIADAFYLMIMLEWELKVRRDPTMMKYLNEKQLQVFNRVTKGNPVNLLNREMIELW